MVTETAKNTKNIEIEQMHEGSVPMLRITGAGELDIGKTFDCGQCFRFDPVESTKHAVEYSGIAFGRLVSFASEGDGGFYIYNSTEKEFFDIWHGFLALDVDYEDVNKSILNHCQSPVMEQAMDCGRGIRILRQDAFEALISFIISQNNNIPRIKKIIESLSFRCGEEIALPKELLNHVSSGSSLHAFPSCPSIISLGEAGLSELKVGFRAKYIYDAVSKISDGSLDLSEVAALGSPEECISALCSVKGVGLKVASCAALFGMGKYGAFPVDVWMKKVGEKYFSQDSASFSGERFGPYAGIAQQYLFYYERYSQAAAQREQKHQKA